MFRIYLYYIYLPYLRVHFFQMLLQIELHNVLDAAQMTIVYVHCFIHRVQFNLVAGRRSGYRLEHVYHSEK